MSRGERGRLVGNGRLALRNPFGQGRTLSLHLSRLPNQVSRVDVTVADPFVLGLPFGVEAGFQGLEQDSTYGKRAYRGNVQTRLATGLRLSGRFSREVVGSGKAGLRFGRNGRQVVPNSRARFFGLGVRVSTLDRVVSPTRGTYVEMDLESGAKERTESRIVDGDTVRETTLLGQRRLQATGRQVLPVSTRFVIVAGGDAAMLLSAEYDRSDLFRFGGASTLRGYDEDRFLGRFTGRALIELRWLMDVVSHAYAFFDLGYVDRPQTPDQEAKQSLYPGYGIGIQYRTPIGLVNVSVAMNPEDGLAKARIHAGLSLGL